MAVKVIGSSLILSFLFLCIMSYKNITEDEFANFKGVDVAATCGCAQSMQNMCYQIEKAVGVSHGNKPFKNGLPKCVERNVQLQKTGGQELVYKNTKMLVCAWEDSCTDDHYGKGQGPNHVMNYNCDPSSCVPYNDIKVQ